MKIEGRNLLILAALALALPASASAAQLRGVMLTPNWTAEESPFYQTPEQQVEEMAAVRRMGGNVVRLHVDWARLQSDREIDPAYEARLDGAVQAAHALGLAVILNVIGTPCWASAVNTECPLTSARHMDPPDPAAFAEVSRYLTARYQPFAYEVWNEPNITKFWHGTPEQFASIANAAVAGAVGPTRVIVGGFLQDGGDFLHRAYRAGMRGHDGVAIHPYSYEGTGWANPAGRSQFNKAIRKARKIQRAHGDRTGLYITEFGFATCPATPCTRHAGRWLAASFRETRRYRYVKAVLFFGMYDYLDPDVPVPAWDRRCGIVGKPSYRQVRRALKQLRR